MPSNSTTLPLPPMASHRNFTSEPPARHSFAYSSMKPALVTCFWVRGARAVTYSPLTEFGGWGIRWSAKGKTAWTTRGNRALRLELADGKVLYVGSDRPERILPFVRPGGE